MSDRAAPWTGRSVYAIDMAALDQGNDQWANVDLYDH